MDIPDYRTVSTHPRALSDSQIRVTISPRRISALIHNRNRHIRIAMIFGRDVVIRSKQYRLAKDNIPIETTTGPYIAPITKHDATPPANKSQKGRI